MEPSAVSLPVFDGDDEIGHVFAERLLLRPPEGHLGLMIPIDDRVAVVDADDRVERVLKDDTSPGICGLGGG